MRSSSSCKQMRASQPPIPLYNVVSISLCMDAANAGALGLLHADVQQVALYAITERGRKHLQLPLVGRNGLQQAVALLLQVWALPAYAIAQQLLLQTFCCHCEVDD